MKRLITIGAIAFLAGSAASANPGDKGQTLVVVGSNAASNQLLVYNTNGQLVQTIGTQGEGGVPAGSNAGGIAVNQQQLAVINFGSKSVSLFTRVGNGFEFTRLVPSVSSPVSVAFGNDHLYILGTTTVESHQLFGFDINTNPDGLSHLSIGDGSAAQVGVLEKQLIVTEKGTPGPVVANSTGNGVIETVNLLGGGAIDGGTLQVVAGGLNAPFGLLTRDNDAYVSIAHANQIALVRNGAVVTIIGSRTQNAPCWVTLDGRFLFSSNSPSISVSRYAVYGQKIVQDAAVAANVAPGASTDIAYGAGVLPVIASGELWIFSVDEDGNLTRTAMPSINAAADGVGVVVAQD